METTPSEKLVEVQPAEPARVFQAETDDGLIAQWSSAATAVSTNIDTKSDQGRALVTRCLSNADMKSRNAVGQILEAVAYFAHVIEVPDKKTGEILKKVRVVLVLNDGRTFSTTSKSCVRCVALIAASKNGKPWNPPILLEVREFPLEDGASYCDMREILRIDPPKGKKG